MRRRARLWPVAVLVSVLAHGVLVGVLALAVDPAPTAPQETPRTRLAISTQAVESQTAPPATPKSERPDAPSPEGTRMDGAAVPVSRARPAELDTSGATALAPAGVTLTPRAEPGQAVTELGALAGEVLAPVEQGASVGAAVAPADLVPDRAAPASPVGQPLVPAEAPAAVRARPADPSPVQAQTVAEGSTQAATVSPGGVSAPVASAQGARLGAAVAEGSRVDAAPAPGRIAISVSVRDDVPVAADTPRPMRIAVVESAAGTEAQPLRIAAGAAAPLVAASDSGLVLALAGLSRPAPVAARPPEAVPVPMDAALAAEAARPAPGDGQPLDARDPGGDAMVPRVLGSLAAPAAQSAPETERVTAALAWSGDGGEGAMDPVSLAAIQSFLRPSDGGQGESTVRDGISGILESVPCARLQTAFAPETGQLELRGHIPEEGLRAPVLAALRAQVGASIPLADNMLVLPRPTCGALSGIASVGLAQSREQTRDPRIVGPTAHARVYSFIDGDRLFFDLTGPDYPAYFYIDYFDAEGMVLHLQPNEIVPLARIDAKEKLVVGQGAAGQPALDIRVGPPFGQEIMVAFAASVPLYDGLRPVREPAGPYLDFLRARVAQARAAHPDFKGEWVYFFVSTRAR
ncbi:MULTISPECIES: DUF4384 domain-containing protein [Meridianimarinicoccus]|uniref:DUF4384 domain-containing protein n=1 Tax=Meridianimarinicoccus zhengii TaxID=2056810 RepID=UPI000DAE252F|nr:DUF4384 domain-containing protein [Phycocomes zhengii]